MRRRFCQHFSLPLSRILVPVKLKIRGNEAECKNIPPNGLYMYIYIYVILIGNM